MTIQKSAQPVRVQRMRTAGWKMPANTVYVGRPGKFGNKYVPNSEYHHMSLARRSAFIAVKNVEQAVSSYRTACLHSREWRQTIRRELRGKNLACWCPLDQPCHADVLLEVANSDEPGAYRLCVGLTKELLISQIRTYGAAEILNNWTGSDAEAISAIEADPRQLFTLNPDCDRQDETGRCQGHHDAVPLSAKAAQSKTCVCSHDEGDHWPMGTSENMIILPRCRKCTCKEFTPAAPSLSPTRAVPSSDQGTA